MIFEFGTIFLLGLCTFGGVSDDVAYNYKGTFSNNNLLKSQQLEVHTDDDDYYLRFDLALNFDIYYKSDSADSYISDLHFITTINRYYYPNPSSLIASYTIDLDCGDYESFEFENLIYSIEYYTLANDDRCFCDLVNADTDVNIASGQVVCIPSGEEFTSSYGFKYNLDFSTLHQQLYDFVQMSKGYDSGYEDGSRVGYQNGYDDGIRIGYQTGYTDGYNEGATQDETAVAIFSGIISVALIPINFFLACLNFEVFGINIGAFVSALLTVAIVVIVTRIIVSGGNGGDK